MSRSDEFFFLALAAIALTTGVVLGLNSETVVKPLQKPKCEFIGEEVREGQFRVYNGHVIHMESYVVDVLHCGEATVTVRK